MRAAICFEYSARPAYLKICIRKFIKPVAMLKKILRTIRNQQCYLGVALHSQTKWISLFGELNL